MQKGSSSFRSVIFKEELYKLKEKNYIDENDYIQMNKAYYYYLQDLEKQKHKRGQIAIKKAIEPLMQKQAAKQEENPKPIAPAKVMTPEKIRERNISWALISGVILLFFGGLVFGTSIWDLMANPFKVILISFVSIVFFGSSYIAEKYFHIQKTAFAFMTLGSLFVPIIFISIGFFELFGYWLSFYGEGKYALGFIGSIVCLSLYTYIASKYKHRLFVWFTYLSATLGAGFLLAMTYLPRDFFYLGIMVYNAVLLFGYHKWKNNQKLSLFTKELPLYSQLNLILSTLLMLFFYNNAVFYSFNILITAILYISMVFVNKTKHYHFVFTFLFIYGMYQLLENSFLHSIDYLGFALIGFVYLILQQYANREENLQRVFQLTSGIVSFFAFLFISVQGLLLRSDGDSIVLFFAYLIIAANYIYLTNIAKQPIFQYLAPVFLMAAGFQSYFIVSKHFNMNFAELYLFAMASIIYIFLYLKNQFKYLDKIKTSSFFVSIGTMVLTILFALKSGELTHASILLLAFGFIALLEYKNSLADNVKKAASWVNPISWGLSLITFFDYLDRHLEFYGDNLQISGHLAICGLILIAVSYFWKNRNQLDFDLNTFLTASAIYTLSILFSPLELVEHPMIASLIYLAGIVLYILLVYKVKLEGLWTFVSVTSLIFLSSLIDTLNMENNPALFVPFSLLIPIILLLVYEFIGRRIQGLKPYFFWTAHGSLLFAMILATYYVVNQNIHPAVYFIALAAYIYSTLKQTREWEIKLFLYAAFTTLPIIIYLTISYYKLEELISGEYLFIIVSGLIAMLWVTVNETWKKRIDWYLIPQSILGMLIFTGYANEQNTIQFVLFILYTIGTLFLLHKRNWRIFTILPLLISTAFLAEYSAYMEKLMQIGLTLAAFLALHLFGRFAYKQLFNSNEKPVQIDWYTVFSWVYIIKLFLIISPNDPLWLRLIPSFFVIYSFYTLIGRFTGFIEKQILKTLTSVSVLLPYYITLSAFNINQYIQTELYTLPFIVLTIFLSRRTWKDYKQIMNKVQWAVLLLVTAILVSDALNSNTIYDALIIGGLSLVSILGGMHYRIKSYFFTGICVLLLNVLLQTRPYWGNFPWWGYLIVAGFTLIGFASFYELQRQRKSSGKPSFFQTKKDQIIKHFKEWD